MLTFSEEALLLLLDEEEGIFQSVGKTHWNSPWQARY